MISYMHGEVDMVLKVEAVKKVTKCDGVRIGNMFLMNIEVTNYHNV